MEDQSPINDIYCFVIDNAADGFAHFRLVYKRKAAASAQTAAAEIISGAVAEDWDEVTKDHAAGDLDMKFRSTSRSLVFVSIDPAHRSEQPGVLHGAFTYFGDDIVSDLSIAPKQQARVISQPLRHNLDGTLPTLCSFELDVKAIRTELGNRSKAKLTRFPIVFDFIDSDDGVSPVFKQPKRATVAGDAKDKLRILDHGGIHPPDGSSLIILDDEIG